VIGLELGSVWNRLGSDVTVIEFMDRVLPGMDLRGRQTVQSHSGKAGHHLPAVLKGHRCGYLRQDAERSPSNLPLAKPQQRPMRPMWCWSRSGARPHTEGLGLESVGVETDERGRVKTDGTYKTNVDGIYAIGDVITGPMLAHKAEDEGIALAEMLAGQSPHINYNTIPNVVYTWPEVASVGKTEEELKEAGIKYKAGKFPFTANGRARAMAATDGFVKFLADAETDEVLGCHIVGAGAGEMIHEVCVLMEYRGAAEDLARICHAHPTLSEAVREAALAVDKRPIHM
jgi:dihydrolipoamide dehydrogenase